MIFDSQECILKCNLHGFSCQKIEVNTNFMSKFASRGFWKQEINQSTSFKIGIFLSKSCHKYEFPE